MYKVVLVFGGRDFSDREAVFAALDSERPDKVIPGGAPGADALAREWCFDRKVSYWNVPADWTRYGKAAGPIRNQRMIDEGCPSLALEFPGGRGTADMHRRCVEAGVPIKVHVPAPNVAKDAGHG